MDRLHFLFLLFSVRRLPWVTISLLAVSWGIYCFTEGLYSHPVWLGTLEWDGLQFIFHPVLQLSLEHLVFNTVLGLAAFTLLEKWTVLMSKNQRRIAFIMCYLASLVAVFIKWKYYGPDLRLVLGLSGMISAAAALLLTYYAFFRKQIRYKGPSVLAPFAIGILFWWVIDPLFEWVFVTRTWLPTELGNTSLFHFLAFLIALVLGSLLMLLARRRTSRQDHSLASM